MSKAKRKFGRSGSFNPPLVWGNSKPKNPITPEDVSRLVGEFLTKKQPTTCPTGWADGIYPQHVGYGNGRLKGTIG